MGRQPVHSIVYIRAFGPPKMAEIKFGASDFQEMEQWVARSSLFLRSVIEPPIFKARPPQGANQTLPDTQNPCVRSLKPFVQDPPTLRFLAKSTCHRVRDGQWGSVVNGEWTGVFKELSDGTADIAVAPLSMSVVRSTKADFLLGLMVSGFKIVLKRPSNEDYMWTVYTKQFEAGVWGVLTLLTTALCFSLYFASRCSSREQKLSPSDAFIVGVGMIFGQGSTLKIEKTSERGIVLMLLLLQVLLLAFYTSNLVSALTVGPPLPPMKDLEDVHSDSSITIGFTRGSTIANEFNTDNPLYQAILHRLKDKDLVMSPEEGVARALKGGYAYLVWEFFYKMNFGSECGAFLLPPSYFPHQASIALQKDSPLVPVLNKVLLDIQSVGLLRKWWMEIDVARADCNALVTAPIELKTVLTPFLLLGLSLMVSLGILALEVVVYRNKRPSAF
ncbi:probable glutamate receptor [Penaeus monodon]|uniref:probable glutamate receptor n=1 Tax=Penaeus monodon TaxID=6687 RepID=UPI0018A72A27|nr:probable glutamate receptor [Penaeus monodon]